MTVVGRALRQAGLHEALLLAPVRRARLAAFVASAKAAAAWQRAELELDVAPDVRVGRGVRVRCLPDTVNRLRLGPGTRVDDLVVFELKGGTVDVGAGVHLRQGTVLNVAGRLAVGDHSLLSWGTIVHCSNDVRLGRMSAIGEYSTIVDSAHHFTEPDAFVYHNLRVGTVVIGDNTWLGAKATITRNSRIGSHCIVAANSTVSGDVPDGHLVAGVPAKVVRPVNLPWRDGQGQVAGAPRDAPTTSS